MKEGWAEGWAKAKLKSKLKLPGPRWIWDWISI